MIYDISCKILIVARLLGMRFDKINGFVRVYDGTRYLILFGIKIYNGIYNRVRYLIS